MIKSQFGNQIIPSAILAEAQRLHEFYYQWGYYDAARASIHLVLRERIKADRVIRDWGRQYSESELLCREAARRAKAKRWQARGRREAYARGEHK